MRARYLIVCGLLVAQTPMAMADNFCGPLVRIAAAVPAKFKGMYAADSGAGSIKPVYGGKAGACSEMDLGVDASAVAYSCAYAAKNPAAIGDEVKSLADAVGACFKVGAVETDTVNQVYLIALPSGGQVMVEAAEMPSGTGVGFAVQTISQ
jgi:hypothetical protein